MEKDTEEDEAVCNFIELLSNYHKRQTTDFDKTIIQTVIKIVYKELLKQIRTVNIIWIFMPMKK